MSHRILFGRVLPVLTVLLMLLGIHTAVGIVALPTVDTAYACNPCECPGIENRDNCQGIEYYAFFTRVSPISGLCYMDAYRFNDSNIGLRVFRATATEIDAVPEFPAQNTLIDENRGIALYRLTSGEFQVNAGPDAQGKMYTLIFSGCPASNRVESNYFMSN